MIASHYAEQVDRVATEPVPLRSAPSPDAPEIRRLLPGDAFSMVDESVGWAWGYAGEDRRVGYVHSEALTAQ